jgi:hypothetical protein
LGRTRNLRFGSEPVIEVVPVLTGAGLIQFIRTATDLFFKVRAQFGYDRFRSQVLHMLVPRCLVRS